MKNFLDGLENAAQKLQDFGKKALPVIQENFDKAFDSAQSAYEKAKPGMKETFDKVVSEAKEAFDKASPVIEEKLERAVSRFKVVHQHSSEEEDRVVPSDETESADIADAASADPADPVESSDEPSSEAEESHQASVGAPESSVAPDTYADLERDINAEVDAIMDKIRAARTTPGAFSEYVAEKYSLKEENTEN